MKANRRMWLLVALCMVFDGVCSGPCPGQETIWEGWGGTGLFGNYLEAMPDLDGDGWPEFMVSEETLHAGRGGVFLYSGRRQKKITVLVGEQPMDQLALMAATGDLDGDGVPDFLLGAINANFGGNQSGSVYQYSGRTLQRLSRWDGEDSTNRYCVVEGTGDVDGDGNSDYIIGAPAWARNSPNYSKGKVYVYSGRSHTELYTLTGEAEYDSMGVLTAIGDLDGDHVDDFLCGAPSHKSNGVVNSGRFYLFSGRTGQLIYSRDGVQVGDQIGVSAAAAGDLDRDGWPDYVIGAFRPYVGGTVYLYSGRSGTVIRQWDSDGTVTEFGRAVAAGKDVNGDDIGDVLVGAPGQGPGKRDLPAAFLYCGRTGNLLHEFRGRDLWDRQGTAVALLGDVTGDDLAEVLVGAPAALASGHSGRVELHAGNDLFLQATWRPQALKLILHTRGGPPGVPAMLTLQVPHQPGWPRVMLGQLDGNGEWRVPLQVPPAFRGLTGTFQSFARNASAAGPPWRDSAVTKVPFR